MTVESPQQPDGPMMNFEVSWARISAAGEVLWRQQKAFQGPSRMVGGLALTDALQLRIAVNTSDGARLIVGDLNGQSEVQAVATGLANLSRVVALPGERLAVASNDSRVALLAPDGVVVWERDYAEKTAESVQNYTEALVFNAARQELLLAGGDSEGGSWMQATDLDGEPTWRLGLADQAADGDARIPRLVSGHGPTLLDVAAGPDGTVLATGASVSDLVYLWVGAIACD